jgi:hypothetical protein
MGVCVQVAVCGRVYLGVLAVMLVSKQESNVIRAKYAWVGIELVKHVYVIMNVLVGGVANSI